MLTQLITETLLGALTGYITNDTAIRSLFKPDGVIEQTRDEFAREAGKLLEDQVLTAAVLEHQLMLPEVQQELADALHSFLQRELPNAFADITLGDLPDYKIAVDRLQTLLLQFAESEKEIALHFLKKYFPVDTLLTEEQCVHLTNQLEQLCIRTIQQEQFAERFWQGWRKEKGTCSLDELGLSALCETVIANLAKDSTNWIDTLQKQYGEQLKEALLQSIQQLHLDSVLLELDSQMERYTLRQYLNCDADTLAHALHELLQSSQGQALLDDVVEKILTALQVVHTPIQQLIPEDMLDDIVPLLRQEVPAVMEEMLDWVWQNKQSVQRMLEETVDEIATEAGGMKGMLLQQLKDSLLGELMQSSDTYRILLEGFLNEKTTDQTVDWLMHKLTMELTENTVGQLIVHLNQNGKLHLMIRQFVYENMERYLAQVDGEKLEQLLNWSSGSLQLAKHKDEVERLLVQVLLFAADRIDLPQLIQQEGNQLLHLPIQQILQIDTDTFAKLLHKVLHQACSYAAETLPQMTSNQVLNPLYDTMLWWLEHHGGQWLETESKKISVQNLLQPVAETAEGHNEQITALLSTTGLQLMQGRLSVLAEEQIQSLSSEEMLELVEDFMGRELQPLNYLGAGMGAAAGATVGMALSTAIPAVSMANPALAVSVLAGKAAVFGAVGYTTNCAAVKGLFWPYEPVAGIRTIQGVIPKQKERFAGSMGRLVDRYVINETILKQQIEQLEAQFHQQQAGKALANQQQLFRCLFAELAMQRSKIAAQLCDIAAEYGTQESEHALKQLGDMPLAFVQGALPVNNTADLRALYQQMLPIADQWIAAQLQKEIPLDALVSSDALWEWLERAITRIPLPDFAAMAQELLHSQQTIQQLAGSSYIPAKESIQYTITRWLAQQSNQAALAAGAVNLLNGDKLFHWLEHNSSVWVKDNLTMLFHWMEELILELLQNRQQELTATIEQELLNRMNLMMQMGYAMMNGGEIVTAIVDRLLHQKLPIFLSVKRRELETMLYHVWESRLSPAVQQLAGTYLTHHTVAFPHTVFRTLLAQPALHRCVADVCGDMLDFAAAQPICSWGSYVTVHDLLEPAQMKLGFQWQTHSSDILACRQMPLKTFCADKLHTITLAQLCAGYNETISTQQLIDCDGVNHAITALVLRLAENISITRLQHWLYWDDIAAALQNGMDGLLQDAHFRSWLQYEVELFLLALAEEPDEILPIACREALIQPAVQAVFATAGNHGTALLSKMQLSCLAEEQLKQMDSAHLELVVRGFAGHYLVHIQNRGWLGAIFALPGMLLYLI